MNTRTSRSFHTCLEQRQSEPECSQSCGSLVQLLRLDLDISLAGCLFLPVLLDPGFEGLARSRIPARECEGGDIGIGDVTFVGALAGMIRTKESVREEPERRSKR